MSDEQIARTYAEKWLGPIVCTGDPIPSELARLKAAREEETTALAHLIHSAIQKAKRQPELNYSHSPFAGAV